MTQAMLQNEATILTGKLITQEDGRMLFEEDETGQTLTAADLIERNLILTIYREDMEVLKRNWAWHTLVKRKVL